MQVSVIVPVYNAAGYLSAAVQSALAQPEVGEVILVEDASTDGSLLVCADLAGRNARVRLLRHDDGKNHGAGASRNLGIRSVGSDYIAFLDADDFFLPDRFSVARALFEGDPDLDGVYEAIGTHFEDNSAQRRWRETYGDRMLTTMTEQVHPDLLFESMFPIGSRGYWSLDGWTVKRALFDKTGLFDEHLRLHQDTAICVKAAAVAKMLPGRLDTPVAMRRVHSHNRIDAPRSADRMWQDRILMWAALWRWGRTSLPPARRRILMDRFLTSAAGPRGPVPTSKHRFRLGAMANMLRLIFQYPALLADGLFWRWHFDTVFSLLRPAVDRQIHPPSRET